MQANPRSIDDLFDSQSRYVVPMFQRLYVWQETPQWTTLWEDVTEKALLQVEGKKTTPHYLGALIIEGVRPSSPREVKRFLVIDGQQRLTTIQLLLCAFRDFAKKNAWVTLEQTVTRYLENPNAERMERPEEELLKLWPTKLNREVFRSIITARSQEQVEKLHPLIRRPRKRKPEPRSKLVEAYLFFARSIESWISSTSAAVAISPEDAAFKLLQALQQDFSVVQINLDEGDDSQEIFYSLNSQGRPLSQSDLLRSLIFMRAEKDKITRDEIFDQYWSRFETSFWSETISRGGRDYSRLDLGLRYFLMAKTGALVDARRVNEEYRRWISAVPPRYPSVKEELADFTRYGERYQWYESTSSLALPSTDLRRVLLDFDVSTALPLIFYLELDAGLDDHQKAYCLLAVESFIARRALTGEETKEYNKLFVEIIGSIRKYQAAEIPQALQAKLLSGGGTTRSWPTDAEVIESAISRQVFGKLKAPALRLMLERLELGMRGKKSEGSDIPSGLQIEHVMPQSWSTHWPLQGKIIPSTVAMFPHLANPDLESLREAIRSRNEILQTLGNLTLLNRHLNPAASNGSFELKQVEYKNSVLRLNRFFDHQKVWDESAISERGKVLGEAICKLWPRPQSASAAAA